MTFAVSVPADTINNEIETISEQIAKTTLKESSDFKQKSTYANKEIPGKTIPDDTTYLQRNFKDCVYECEYNFIRNIYFITPSH